MMRKLVHPAWLPVAKKCITPFRLKPLAVATALASLSGAGFAADFSQGDLKINWDTTATYGMVFRAQERDPRTSQGSNGLDGKLDNFATVVDNAFIINSDDGNNSFDQGLVSNRLSFLSEADVSSGDFGLFVRGKIYYDQIYNKNQNDMTADAYRSFNGNPRYHKWGGNASEQGEFNPEAREYLQYDARLLDYFVYGSFDLGDDRTLQMRVGRQVISWGEALMSGGGLATAINRIDAQIRSAPGLEIKELFLPLGAVYGQINLSETLNFEAFVQYEWAENILDPTSSYTSEFDSIGAGGDVFIFLTGDEITAFGQYVHDYTDEDGVFHPEETRLSQFLPRDDCEAGEKCNVLITHKVMEIKPSDNGQFGLSLKKFFDDGAEMGFYFVNYHEKIPSFILPLDAANDYAKFIDLLIKVADPQQYEDVWEAKGGFKGIADLSSDLSAKQFEMLLNFFYALPEESGTVVEITNNFIHNMSPLLQNVNITAEQLAAGLNFGRLIGAVDAELQLDPNARIRSMNYRLEYFDNTRMWATTYSTVIGEANVAAELSYKENAPVMRGNVARSPDEQEVYQVNANAIFVLQPAEVFGQSLWDFSTFTTEVVSWYLPGRKDFDFTDMDNPDRLAVQNTKNGLGYSFLWTIENKGIIEGLDWTIPVYVTQGLDGSMFTSGFRNGQSSAAIGSTFKYLDKIEFGISYFTNFGNKEDIFQRLTHDRDSISIYTKYGF